MILSATPPSCVSSAKLMRALCLIITAFCCTSESYIFLCVCTFALRSPSLPALALASPGRAAERSLLPPGAQRAAVAPRVPICRPPVTAARSLQPPDKETLRPPHVQSAALQRWCRPRASAGRRALVAVRGRSVVLQPAAPRGLWPLGRAVGAWRMRGAPEQHGGTPVASLGAAGERRGHW